MDFQKLVAQAVRVRRGARTQMSLSRFLGYKSNVLFAWENGHDEPSARSFFRLVEKTGPAPDVTLLVRGKLEHPLSTREGITELLHRLLGHRKLTEVSEGLDVDRHAVGRWLRGRSDIRMCDLLRFVAYTSLSLYDFLASFVDPSALPEAAQGYEALLAAREAAKTMPWAHAIVHMVELPSYRSLSRHEPGWFASRLGISTQEEITCLRHLLESGQLRRCGDRYETTEQLTVDTRQDPGATRQLASFWMQQASARVLSPGQGRFGFNTFGVSARGLEEILELQSDYFRRLRAIVAESEPTEAVVVAIYALMPLANEDAASPRGEPGSTRTDRSRSVRRAAN